LSHTAHALGHANDSSDDEGLYDRRSEDSNGSFDNDEGPNGHGQEPLTIDYGSDTSYALTWVNNPTRSDPS
jgi:hypothetical protein